MEEAFPAGFLMPKSQADRESRAAYLEMVANDRAKNQAESQVVAVEQRNQEVELSPKARAIKDRVEASFRRQVEPQPATKRSNADGTGVTNLSPAPKDERPSDAAAVAVAATGSAENTSEPVSPRSTALTDFPIKSVAELKRSDDPLSELITLRRQILDHNDYARVRENYCSLAIQLNELGRLAPAYRPEMKAKARRGDPRHMVLHRDQVVIDLHWCYARKMLITPLDMSHQALFDAADAFQFDLAWRISGEKWLGTYRAAEALALTTLQQCQLRTLRGPELVERLKGVQTGWLDSNGKRASKVAMTRRQIGQWAERQRRIVNQRDYYEKLWLARELFGPDGSNQLIAELHALMVGGDVQDRATIRDKLKSLDRQLVGM